MVAEEFSEYVKSHSKFNNLLEFSSKLAELEEEAEEKKPLMMQIRLKMIPKSLERSDSDEGREN